LSWYHNVTICIVKFKLQGNEVLRGLKLVPGKELIHMNYITYYMYNITNPDEFEAGEKPEFEEIGPYVYR